MFTVKRIQYSLDTIDLKDLDEKTLAFGDNLSKKEHGKLNALYMLIEHYHSITTFHDKFNNLHSIKREIKNSKWAGLRVDNTALKNQNMIMKDLNFLRENESSIFEILNINKLIIQELKSYFYFNHI